MVFDRNIYISGKNNLTMSQIDITKMSSKGQVVIPQDLRKGISDGDKLVVIRNKDQIILRKPIISIKTWKMIWNLPRGPKKRGRK